MLYSFQEEFNKLNYLESGQCLTLIRHKDDEKLIIEASGKRFLFPYLLLLGEPSPFKILVQSDAVIHSYPFFQNPVTFFAQNIPTAKLMLNSIMLDFNELFRNYRTFFSFYKTVEMLFDNMILYLALSKVQANLLLYSDEQFNLFAKSREYEKLFADNKGFFPGKGNTTFIKTDNSRALGKTYQFEIKNSGTTLNQTIVNSVLAFKKIDDKIFETLMKTNGDFVYFLFKAFSQEISSLIADIGSLYANIDFMLKNMFSTDNNLSYITLKGVDGSVGHDACTEFYKFFESQYNTLTDCYKNYFKIISTPFKFNIKDDILHIAVPKKEEPKSATEPAKTTPKSELDSIIGGILSDEKEDIDIDSIIAKEKKETKGGEKSKILSELYQYSGFSGEEADLLAKALNAFYKLTDKVGDSDQVRRIQKAIRSTFPKLYEKTLNTYLKTGKSPKTISLFLKYGVIDERLITEEDLSFIMDASDKSVSEFEVYDAVQWFDAVYNQKLEPSINDMGQSWDEVKKEEERSSRKDAEKPLPIPDDKLHFEAENLIQHAYPVLTTSPLNALPIFYSENMRGKVADAFVTREKISKELNELRGIDYSLFWREAIFRDETQYDIFKKEVLPYCVIIPTIGEKIFLWQDSGPTKYHPARFIFPAFFCGDFKKAIIQACGTFRWEINKTIKGPQWADALDGGITGAYVDYMQTYKRSNEISQELKTSIQESLSKFRSDRERFANDYWQWVFFESQGILRLNMLIRRTFLTEIPFRKDMLLKLQKIPAYENIVTAFMNRRTQEIKKYISRYRKFEDENGTLPDEIQKFMNYLKT